MTVREQLRQELLDKQLGWRTKDKADGAGADFVDCVSKLLWYLTDHWGKLLHRKIHLPTRFEPYKDKSRHKVPLRGTGPRG